MRLMLTFLGLLLAMACERQTAAPKPASATERPASRPFKFVVVSHATAVPFFVPVRKGVEEAGRLLGVDASFTGPPDFDVARQIEFIKAAIAAGADGIGATLPNSDAFNDVVAEAKQKGIPIVALNADAPKSGRLAYIGQGNYEAGRSMGREIARLLPGGGHVLLCTHTAGAFNLEERLRGVRDTLQEGGKFTQQTIATSTDLVKASAAVGSYFQGHPETKGFFGVDDITVRPSLRSSNARD